MSGADDGGDQVVRGVAGEQVGGAGGRLRGAQVELAQGRLVIVITLNNMSELLHEIISHENYIRIALCIIYWTRTTRRSSVGGKRQTHYYYYIIALCNISELLHIIIIIIIIIIINCNT